MQYYENSNEDKRHTSVFYIKTPELKSCICILHKQLVYYFVISNHLPFRLFVIPLHETVYLIVIDPAVIKM